MSAARFLPEIAKGRSFGSGSTCVTGSSSFFFFDFLRGFPAGSSSGDWATALRTNPERDQQDTEDTPHHWDRSKP